MGSFWAGELLGRRFFVGGFWAGELLEGDLLGWGLLGLGAWLGASYLGSY